MSPIIYRLRLRLYPCASPWTVYQGFLTRCDLTVAPVPGPAANPGEWKRKSGDGKLARKALKSLLWRRLSQRLLTSLCDWLSGPQLRRTFRLAQSSAVVLSSNVRRWGTTAARRALSFVLPFFATPTPWTHSHTLKTPAAARAQTRGRTHLTISTKYKIYSKDVDGQYFLTRFYTTAKYSWNTKYLLSVFLINEKNDNPHKGNNKAKQPSKPNRSNCKLQCLLRLKPLAKKAKTQQHRNSINTKQQLTYIFRQVKHGRLYYVYDVSAWVSVCVCVLVWCRTNWYATLFLPLSCHAFLWLVIMVSLFYMPFAMSSSLCVLWECVCPPIFPPTLSSQFLRSRREQARN